MAQGNLHPAAGSVRINLKGVGVGNGLTVPLAQYPEYSTLAYNWTMEKLGKPVITLATYQQMQSELKVCLPAIEACQTDTAVCALAQSVCNNAQIGPYEATGLNPYNIRLPCEVPGLCYDESHVTAFFNDKAIQQALGVDTHATTWQTCNYNVNGAFSSDWMKQFAEPYISSQLEAGTRVLIYAGDLDFICNWLGSQAWTFGLNWSGKAGFNSAAFKNWTADGVVAGKSRTFGGLTFLQVFEAGCVKGSRSAAAPCTHVSLTPQTPPPLLPQRKMQPHGANGPACSCSGTAQPAHQRQALLKWARGRQKEKKKKDLFSFPFPSLSNCCQGLRPAAALAMLNQHSDGKPSRRGKKKK